MRIDTVKYVWRDREEPVCITSLYDLSVLLVCITSLYDLSVLPVCTTCLT